MRTQAPGNLYDCTTIVNMPYSIYTTDQDILDLHNIPDVDDPICPPDSYA